MKVVYFAITLLLTIAVIIVLDTSFGKIPAFGRFLSPQHGFWQNAEPSNTISDQIATAAIRDNVSVYFDNREVPHIFASNITDAYFIQGYLHAYHRLWQMEFQTMAAGGRLSEVLGAGPDSAYLNNDRKMRRMGMVFGAERSLQKMEQDESTKSLLDSYTAGVNTFIENLPVSRLPLEYRLLNYIPEKWNNMKTALLLKYLSLDLTGSESDIEHTNAHSFFSREDYDKLYPLIHDDADPVIPKETQFSAPSVTVAAPATADSLYYKWRRPTMDIETIKVDKDNGSNNWAVSGNKTKSGRPILCNDPHLGLNLPSLWYEVQITTPEGSVYGASLPGAPAVIIGFNDSIAWGVTNAGRDVLDFYEIEFNDEHRVKYRYNGKWLEAEQKIEAYKIKGGATFYDTVSYTVWGPVMYDRTYNGRGRVSAGVDLAIRWRAHDPSNEFKTFELLNKARNIDDYKTAISYFQCPGQNFAFASKSGDIAIWQQGRFPARWYRQGEFVMPGGDSSYRWQADIPLEENLHQVNPARGFVSSANQIAADTSYPYFLGTDYDVYRGVTINKTLGDLNNITPEDMQQLQNNNYNAFAAAAVPYLLQQTDTSVMNADQIRYLKIIREWKYRNDNDEAAPTIFTLWIDALEQLIWSDEFARIPSPTDMPSQITLIDQLRKDSSFRFVDDIQTPAKETPRQVVTAAFQKASTSMMYADRDGKLKWSRFKDAGIRHLLRMEQLSRFHLNTGGGVNVVNATKQFHGPSWKMVVHLTDETEAYGIYPGGQNGNPGSRTFDEFVDDWAAGKYYRLWMMKKNESSDRRVKATFRFVPK